MKKYFLLGAIALSMGVMVSCGDEEIEKPGNGTENGNGNNNDIPNERNGLKAVSFGNDYLTGYNDGEGNYFNVLYDNGYIKGLEANEMVMLAEGNGFALKTDEASIVISGIKTNADGNITALREVDTYPDETYSLTYNFTYTGKNLTKIECRDEWKEEGESGVGNETLTLTWTNGNLTKVKQVGQDLDSNGKAIEEWTNEYSISYGDEKNTFKQYTFMLADVIDMEGFALPLFGLLGEGPKQLPNNVVTYYDGNLSHRCDISYTINPTGTIASEVQKSYNEEWEDETWFESFYYEYSSSSAKKVNRVDRTNLESFMQKTLRHHNHGRK